MYFALLVWRWGAHAGLIFDVIGRWEISHPARSTVIGWSGILGGATPFGYATLRGLSPVALAVAAAFYAAGGGTCQGQR